MSGETKSPEERLSSSGWTQCPSGGWHHEEVTEDGPHAVLCLPTARAIRLLDREAAAEARGRAQGQREGREAERAAMVADIAERQGAEARGGKHLGAAGREGGGVEPEAPEGGA